MPAQSLSFAADAYGDDIHANDDICRRTGRDAATDRRAPVRVVAVGAERASVSEDAGGDLLVALRELPQTATVRDVVEAVLGERPIGHGQTYANVVLLQRALARLAEAASGRPVAPVGTGALTSSGGRRNIS